MKKITVILFGVLTAITLTACGGEKKTEEGTSDNGNTIENFSGETASTGNDSTENTLSGAATEPASDKDSPETEEMKILVAYFSATNTTEGVAETIADSLSADIYEIEPEQPYTDDDLNYHDDNSRSTIEMNDSLARPAISGSVENMEQYNIVFIGYPIWWGQAPKIMYTFMESYDFSGKTIVPFCTSGSSSIGTSATNLEKLTSGAIWKAGTRFSGSASQNTIMEWVRGLGLDFGE